MVLPLALAMSLEDGEGMTIGRDEGDGRHEEQEDDLGRLRGGALEQRQGHDGHRDGDVPLSAESQLKGHRHKLLMQVKLQMLEHAFSCMSQKWS